MTKTYINACLRWLVNEVYPFYRDKNIPKQLRAKINTFYDVLNKNFDWTNPKKEELVALGFLNWEDTDEGVWFIPQWLYPAIPDGIIVYDQYGSKFEFQHDKSKMDEVMFGCLNFGVKLGGIDDRTTNETT